MADVLVVEDDPDLRELIGLSLEAEGHQIRLAVHGADALRAIDQRYPSLVVSDVEMPVLDGPAMVYRMFVENLGRENIPLILISALDTLATVAQAVGTPYYVAKPFSRKALIKMVDHALEENAPPRPPSLLYDVATGAQQPR